MWENGIYLRFKRRRPIRLAPYSFGEDMQDQAPAGWCCFCGKEVYNFGKFVCEECEKWVCCEKSRAQ